MLESSTWLIGLIITIVVGLGGWVLARVFLQQGLITNISNRTSALEANSKIMMAQYEVHTELLSEVRDTMLMLKIAVTGSSGNDGLLGQFREFTQRFDERSAKTETLTRDLDKRLALVELHLQYLIPTTNDHNQLGGRGSPSHRSSHNVDQPHTR